MSISVNDLLNEGLGDDQGYKEYIPATAPDNDYDPAGQDDCDYYDDDSLDESAALRGIAECLSILQEDTTQEELNEAMNVIRLNKQSKMTNLAHRTALVLAKNAKDPLYDKYAKFNGIRLQLRDQIFRKYGSKANVRARQLMTGTAKPMTR
jgi:hypothetical protein